MEFVHLQIKGMRGRRWLRWGVLVTVTALVVGVTLLRQPVPAAAHCDSVKGPVVTAAKRALDAGNVKLILPYVQANAEAELTATFQQTLAVRKLGGAAKELAERYFFETAVRLHRQGEGASYTGLKAEDDFGPALAAADKTLETGELQPLQLLLDKVVQEGISQKFAAVQQARTTAAKQDTVAAQRARAEAELTFEKYIDELYKAATALNVQHEGE